MADTMTNVFSVLDQLLKNADLADVTSESSGFTELPDGYYLCEVTKGELKTSKTSGNPMAALQMKVVADGINVEIANDGTPIFKPISKTAKRMIFLNYVFKDEQSIKRFATDMLKFEASPGESLLPKEAFTTSATIVDALDALIGSQVYVQVSTSESDDGKKNTWNNMVSWKRASILGLPE